MDFTNGSLVWAVTGANRVVGCLDWCPTQQEIAFGAHNYVAIYHTNLKRITGVLNGHTGQVNCVKWMPTVQEGDGAMLCSASSDATVRLWRWRSNVVQKLAVLEGFQSGVTCLAIHLHYYGGTFNPSCFLAACSSDPNVSIWECASLENVQTWKQTSTICTSPRIQHSLALCQLATPADHLLLALGGTDAAIRLYVRSLKNGEFQAVCTLRGHNDWIRGLALHSASEKRILLASASQDRFVRVWSLHADQTRDTNPLVQLAPSTKFTAEDVRYTVKLDGLLTGHEDWVHSVQFRPGNQPLQLLSTSMDRTMILWEWDSLHKCWTQTESVGDAGCSALGYFSGVFSPDGTSIVSHGFTGALHLWSRKGNGDDRWVATPAMTGHYDAVVDMCLTTVSASNSTNRLSAIFTVSKDQTSRIWALLAGNLHEIARPQVHGHDFFGIVTIPNRFPNSFASCSEEKVIRVFSAPKSYQDYLATNNIVPTEADPDQLKGIAYGATIKALALTNTAIYEDQLLEQSEQVAAVGMVESYTPGPDFAPNAQPSCISGVSPCVNFKNGVPSLIASAGAPLEEHLCQNTLWPEIQKLYGHGDVVYSLAISPCGRYLASACKAQKEDVAVVFIWNAKTWTPQQQLRGHLLTITRMEFSPNGDYLLTGSRDRSFCIFHKRDENFEFHLRKPKAHQRIIWDVSWSSDNLHFATASRDQTIKIWSIQTNTHILQISCPYSVTSIAFQPASQTSSNRHNIAAGLQNGDLCIWQLEKSNDGFSYKETWRSTEDNKHSDSVHRVLWTSSQSLDINKHNDNTVFLATCSADHSLRLYKLQGKLT